MGVRWLIYLPPPRCFKILFSNRHMRGHAAWTKADGWTLDIEMLLAMEKIECRLDITEEE